MLEGASPLSNLTLADRCGTGSRGIWLRYGSPQSSSHDTSVWSVLDVSAIDTSSDTFVRIGVADASSESSPDSEASIEVRTMLCCARAPVIIARQTMVNTSIVLSHEGRGDMKMLLSNFSA